MVLGARGHVDFGHEGFIARFMYDRAIVARIKAIQRRHWANDQKAWIVAPHWPSVRRLLHIASELGWEITAEARSAEQRVKEDSESLEYSVDVIHGDHGEAWFQCKAADDDELQERLKAIPGAYWEGAWCIPTDWDRCCAPLLEIVQSNMQLEVSEAAWRLLEEPDVAHLFVRSSAPPLAAGDEFDDASSSDDWIPTAEEIDELDSADASAGAAPTLRRARVTAQSKKRPASPPADEEVG
jgi:hypothetical protein